MFIAFDGMDGVGKNTQIQRIVDHYKNSGIHFEVLDFGGAQYFKKYLKKINSGEVSASPELRELIYYFEGLYVNMNTIKPNKEKRNYIIDRYYLSYIVYGQLNGIPKEEIYYFIKNLIEPDLYFFLDAPPEETYERITSYRSIEPAEVGFKNFTLNGNKPSMLNDREAFVEFQNKVRKLYKTELKENHILIESNKHIDVVANEIIEIIDNSGFV